MSTTKALLLTASIAILCAGCETKGSNFTDCTVVVAPGADPNSTHDAVQTALSNAQPGNVICFAEGTYSLQDQLVLTTPNVELRGASSGRSIFDFANQVRGPNGVSVIADGFLMDYLTVKNSAQDAIRIQQSKGITLHDVTITWDAGPSPQNGGYGFYPTESADVLMENCKVSYAEDAGFYIGQSQNVVIRNNEAFGNVVGIEIENSTEAEAYGNDTHDNVAGFFLSNLPNLPHHGNSQIAVYDNRIENNNQASFAAPGNTESAIPAGAGIMVLATTDVDIHDNTIEGNESFGAGVFSYAIAMRNDYLSDATYEEFPARDYIHDNHFKNNGLSPQDEAGLIATIAGVTKVEDIVWDGELAPGTTPSLCLSGNGGATYRNIDYADLFAHTNTDISAVTCQGTSVMPLAAFPPLAVAQPEPTQPHELLSEYGFFTGDLKAQIPAAGVTPYEVAVSLYSDAADKLRFIVLPPGGKITFDPTGQWQFPDGTTLIKTFFYYTNPLDESAGRTLIETRLEMLISGTWTLQTYLWNDAQTEATRFVAGKTVQPPNVAHPYRVPSSAECHICHLSNNATVPLGPRTWQMNVPIASGTSTVNQLDAWASSGFFTASVPSSSTLAHLSDPFGSDSLDVRARSYLQANCAHCHSEGGTADATGLTLTFDTTDLISLGYCRSPVSAGPGSGDLYYDIVPGQPKQSILWFRMQASAPDAKMPQLPTTTNDALGVGLISEWITSLTGNPCPAP
jgi:parallel beta-helix repeat protein